MTPRWSNRHASARRLVATATILLAAPLWLGTQAAAQEPPARSVPVAAYGAAASALLPTAPEPRAASPVVAAPPEPAKEPTLDSWMF